MPRKCSVGNCKSNYDSSSTSVWIYQFPKNPEQRKQWIDALPNILTKDPTDNMGVCSKHWPPDTEMIKPYRSRRFIPKHPPSLFEGCSKSMFKQVKTQPRASASKLSLANRNAEADELQSFTQVDVIESFVTFSDDVKLRYPEYYHKVNSESVKLFDIEETYNVVQVHWSIKIDVSSQQISAYKKHTIIYCYDILSFSHKLSRWSQLHEIINRVKQAPPDLISEIKFLIDQLDQTFDSTSESVSFVLEQLKLLLLRPQARRYSGLVIRYALQLFLSSRSSYRLLCNLLAMPHPKTLKSKLGRIGDVGSMNECRETVKTVFSHLSSDEKKVLYFI